MRIFSFLLLLSVLRATAQTAPAIIPAPASLTLAAGTCPLGCLALEPATGEAEAVALLLAGELGPLLSKAECDKTRPIRLRMILPDTLLPEETYWLNVSAGGIDLTAVTAAGLYRGTRTLMQLLEQYRAQGGIPCLSITDHPRFPWRGMHLDVCRHFFSVDFVKQYIDLLARYRMNSFHWHLTDDQGWRIEIKKYPKLTEVGAWRNGSQVGPYGRREYDTLRYGGFYTQEQIREVVAYAAARHINVVPEIEMPGHALAALAAYPRYSCTGGPFEVEKGWGVFPDVFCPGNDSTFAFLEGVLDEVIALFPSPYIHIGGDECPHERWEACPRCQARMKAEGLKTTDELQSYVIRRIERYVNGKGRKIIGWDEILQGGLAPNATVMSWQGIDGGIAAAKSGHDAVMSPGSHCYFDHYQGDPANEPLAIGGYTPIQKVYGYEPVPDGLTPEQARHILGGQGNLWTEYILTPEHVEYMALPRMAALAEVLWSPKAQRNEADFIRRLEIELQRLDALDVHYSKSLYTVAFGLSPGPRSGELAVGLNCPMPGEVRFNTDGGDPAAAYTAPLVLTGDAVVTARLTRDGKAVGATSTHTFRFNKATARKITTDPAPHERYNEGGPFTLVDGITAGTRRVKTEWLGWRGDVTATVDLGSAQPIGEVALGTWHEVYAWIHAPKQVVVSTSLDGKAWTPFATVTTPVDAKGRTAFIAHAKANARYVRLQVQHAGTIPTGLPGSGSPSWLFLDEIEVK